VESGFDGARVDEIARRSRSNKRMIYVYFGSKEDLYVEVLRTAVGAALSSSFQPDEGIDDPREQVAAAVRNYFNFLRDNPAYLRLLAWENLSGGNRAGDAVLSLAASQHEYLTAAVRRGGEQGVFRAGLDHSRLVALVAGMISSHFTDAARHAALSGTFEPVEAEVWLDTILDFVLAGIASPSDKGRSK